MSRGKAWPSVQSPTQMFTPRSPILAFSASALVALALAPTLCRAALEADVTTSRGVVTIDLAYAQTPRAVANFVTLAEGSRDWVSGSSGAVNSGPLYDGLAFHRVENTATSKIAETGARHVEGNDDAGFTLIDEFHPSLTHHPYVVAMAGDGPNTGSCRWYFTGNLAMPERDGRNVVFGKVTSPASRAIIDSILSGGTGATTVTGIKIRRTDPAAEAFDELGVALPEVSPVGGALSVQPGVAVRLNFPQPASTVLRAKASTDLAQWTPRYRSFAGIDNALPPALQIIDPADQPRRFYNFSITHYPGAGGTTTLASRTLVTETSHAGRMTYQFDATGLAGTYVNQPDPVMFPDFKFQGNFTVRSELFQPILEPYYMKIHIQTPGLGDTPNQIIRGGFDTLASGSVSGRQTTDFYTGGMVLVFQEPQPSMPLQLSRP